MADYLTALLRVSGEDFCVGRTNEGDIYLQQQGNNEPVYMSVDEAELVIMSIQTAIKQIEEGQL